VKRINEDELINTETDNTSKDMYLTFKLEDEAYGFDISYVTEIVGIQPITPIPEAAGYMKGIMNLRGRIIPVIDLRLKFGRQEKEYDGRTCIIVISYGNTVIGFIVDSVSEVITLKEDQLVPLPSYGKELKENYVKYIGKAANGIKLLLDCSRIIEKDELNMIEDLIAREHDDKDQ
jgi:purine-binding chemotaxis protein CheW